MKKIEKEMMVIEGGETTEDSREYKIDTKLIATETSDARKVIMLYYSFAL